MPCGAAEASAFRPSHRTHAQTRRTDRISDPSESIPRSLSLSCAGRPLRSPSGLAPQPAVASNQIGLGLRRHDAPFGHAYTEHRTLPIDTITRLEAQDAVPTKTQRNAR